MIIETTNGKYITLLSNGLLINRELKDDFKFNKVESISAEKCIKHLRRELSDEEILSNLSSCTSLVLGITEECNFRCRYCVFSGKYINDRIHSNKKMDFKTAKQAVDLFFKTIFLDTRRKRRNEVYIGFYGGECLLEFNLIKDIIDYAAKKAIKQNIAKRFKILYRLTTNGYLLTDEIVDFLKENDVIVDVSLDGPEKEHDKFRITKSSEKTWNKIMFNLSRLKERYNDYYNRKIYYLITLHPDHNFESIDRFFLDNPKLFKNEKLQFNLLLIKGLKKKEYDKLKKITYNSSELNFLKVIDDLNSRFALKNKKYFTNFTGNCFPGGEKLFVDTNGELNICEKMSQKAPKIGDVKTGFNFNSIRRIINEFNEEVIKKKCWECQYWFLCTACFASSFNNGKFQIDCTDKESHKRLLKKYVEYLEEKDEKNGKYNLKCSCNITDFIEQL